MDTFCHKRILFLIGLFFIIFYDSAEGLILPPDPFDSTDRYARLITASEGTITGVKAKVKAPGDPLGPGEVRALLQYKLQPPPGNKAFHSAASSPISIQTLSNSDSVLAQFDFLSPIPAEAYHHTLMIYYQGESSRTLLQISEYGSDQLLSESLGVPVQDPPPPQGGVRIWGPITFLRERENPKTEQISIPISDPTGSFLLRLSNGTSEGTNRVSSAVIKLNDQEIFRPSDLNQQIGDLSRRVTLVSGENQLEVRLRSAPGAFVTLELFRMEKQACEVLGLRTFIRTTGKPELITDTFELGPQFSAPFTFNLTNGNPDGSSRLDSVIITLNGTFVFYPNNFNEQVGTLSQVVPLQSTNTLDVELRGAPGDFLSLGISGYDHTPPHVTITNPSNGATFRAGSISVSGIVDDPSASVTVEGISVPVASDGSFTLDGVVLQEGENRIEVIAADACGNMGEDQIVVYLQPVPQGPSLEICAQPIMPTIAITAAPGGGEDCSHLYYMRSYRGTISGTTDETAVSLTLNGVLLPDGVPVIDEGDIYYGLREGNFIWVRVNIPPIDGTYSYTAVATNAEGGRTESIVYFVYDTVPPVVTITSPLDGWVTSNGIITVTGTIDDPQATIRLGWDDPPLTVTDGTFTAQASLREGLNYIYFTAIDLAKNYAEAGLRVTLDTTPPEIALPGLTEGMAGNSSTLNVAGIITDETIETVTVTINGGSPQVLSLTDLSFSGALTLIPGLNTLVFTATDRAGNTSSVTRTFLVDLDPPVVAITSPVSGAHVSGTISVAVAATDAVSGIAGVTLFVDGQSAGSLSQPPFNFSVDTLNLANGSHTITVRAIDNAGNQGEASITVLVSALAIEIISPLNGATVNQSKVLVHGKIYNQTGEVGVVINGVLAEVQGNDFAAIVPLQTGQNILTAVATVVNESQVQTSATINTDTQQEMIRLMVYPTSGILKPPANTLDVAFEAEVYLPNPVLSYSWDFNGDGTAEITGADSKFTAQYQGPGLYFPRITVTDTQGNIYTETAIINVFSLEELDALLRSKWEGVKGKLLSADIEGALAFFDESAKPAYRELFNTLSSLLPIIVQEMSDIQLNEYASNAVIYDIRTIRDGIEYSFHLLFTQDSGGIWRISSF
ncbi:MAG: Ig-like domain-containing protein [Deltaproteobacteria bacterium]|nr:Ig-like domain-containing protein [Deltaproteobacteria bacterium]